MRVVLELTDDDVEQTLWFDRAEASSAFSLRAHHDSPMVLTKQLLEAIANGSCHEPFPHEPHYANIETADLFFQYRCQGRWP